MQRRTLLIQALASAGLAAAPTRLWAAPQQVENVTRLYPVMVARIETPADTHAVQMALRAWPGQVAVGGGRYSMGGQIGVAGGLHVDMRQMNRLLKLDVAARVARVQAGMSWRDLQDHLDPVGLAVKTMQSYANFTVGGAVSVNAHGRYVGHGPVGHSVRALRLVLADGQVVETSRQERPELLAAAIGGYGAVGVITEVELDLADNLMIERRVEHPKLQDYVGYFLARVLGSPDAVLHNADLLPPHFDRPSAVTWRRAKPGTALTEPLRLSPRGKDYALERKAISLTSLPLIGGPARQGLEWMLKRGKVVTWLNHEASLDVRELEPASREQDTFVLQEFFVPPEQFLPLARALAPLLQAREPLTLNVSIRHSPADQVSLLPWAKGEVFCFVLYYRQGTSAAAQEHVGRWTRELIALALRHGGRYYLPYQLHATREQFEAGYPGAVELRRLRAQIDPNGRLSNELWRRYL